MVSVKPLVAIVGETGSGKSSLALKLAKQFNGEIISADSWQVYRGFDTGTAKPTATERQAVRHHLLDVAEPVEGFNAALFKELANKAISDIHSRGKLAILVGGTGLYVDSVIYDFGFLPVVASSERAMRNERELSDLLVEARERGVDLGGIDIRNKRRVIRALESGGQRPSRHQLRPHTLLVGIRINREELHERITQRVDLMLERGLAQEVRKLSGSLGWDVEPMKGIGYQEWREHFQDSQSLEETRERIIKATMHLAKRQRTWFKRNSGIQWVDNSNQAIVAVKTFLSQIEH